jgi:hypothetical protein
VLLRSIGELERTLLHEMLHVVVENKAHPSLPEWFREGCVLYLVGTPAPTRKYQALRKRLSDLVAAHGKTAVMEWLQRGLPAEVADQRGERQPGHHAN